MEKASASGRPVHDAYEKVALSDSELDGDIPELESNQDTVTTGWEAGQHRRRPRTILSTLWICARFVFIASSVFAWGASLWLTHRASVEIARAQALLPNQSSTTPTSSHISHDSSGSSSNHKITNPHHDSLNTIFIPGGRLPVAGYGLAYNTTYCNGWEDPEGAKARGCVLDPSQGGWVHELCHDPSILKEWLELPDFGWYLDSKREQRIPQDRVWAADIPGGVNTTMYTAQNFHIQHCKFVMRLRVKHTTRRNRGLGYLPLDPSHMNHCIHLMTEEADPNEMTQVILGKFGGGTEGFGLGGECYMPIL
ncbi:hypothetical protein F4861DRAFT_94908 [Xylaria intraflava]|nr:hypothetical protein F4861DRAFT_94908 [Xylaria intraflava]